MAFFARKGKRRSLFLVSVLDGQDRSSAFPIEAWTRPRRPACCRTAGTRSSPPSRRASPTSTCLDLESGKTRNLTQDAFYDTDPQVSPGRHARRLHPADQRPRQGLRLPPRRPVAQDPAHLRRLRRRRAHPSPRTARRIYYSSTRTTTSQPAQPGPADGRRSSQYTDALGGNMAPAPLHGRGGRAPGLHQLLQGRVPAAHDGPAEPLKEVEQEVQAASEGLVDFQPDVSPPGDPGEQAEEAHVRGLFLEGRPPLNVGVTSSGDFFGGTQVALTDVLGDQNFLFTALSVARVPQLRGHLHQPRRSRLHYGISGFDNTRFFYAAPYGLRPSYAFREGALATQRYTGGSFIAQYPLDKFRRLEFSAGRRQAAARASRTRRRRPQVCAQAAAPGVLDCFLNNGTLVPFTAALTEETTRFRSSGRSPAAPSHRASSCRPPFGEHPLAQHVRGRRPQVLAAGLDGDTRSRCAPRASTPAARTPPSSISAATWSCAATPTCGFVGNEGFFANAELRFPLIDLAEDAPRASWARCAGTALRRHRRRQVQGGSATSSRPATPGISYVNEPDLRRAGVRLPPGGRPRLLRHRPAVLLPGLPAALRLDEAHRPQGGLRRLASSTSGSASTSSCRALRSHLETRRSLRPSESGSAHRQCLRPADRTPDLLLARSVLPVLAPAQPARRRGLTCHRAW